MTVFTAVAAIGALTLVLAFLLSVANRRLRVFEDPRIDVGRGDAAARQLRRLRLSRLPAVRRGRGQRRGTARASARVGTDEQARSASPPSSAWTSGAEETPRRAAGLRRRRERRAPARALRRAAELPRGGAVAGGGKGCFWGCLGFADCERSCDFDAIRMDELGLPVVDEATCTACGDCVSVCPRDLFSLQAVEPPAVGGAAATLEHGDAVLADCEVACTACGRCAMDAADGLVTHAGQPAGGRLRRRNARTGRRSSAARPGRSSGSIPSSGPIKGAASPPVIRQSRLRDGAS